VTDGDGVGRVAGLCRDYRFGSDQILCHQVPQKADTDYVTTESCNKCEKHNDDMQDAKELREDLRAMKRLLFVLAEKQGVKAEDLRELIR